MAEVEAKGPSKKELNKLARKEKATTAPTDNTPPVYNVAVCRDNSQNPDLTRTVELFAAGSVGKIRYTPLDAKKSFPILTTEIK